MIIFPDDKFFVILLILSAMLDLRRPPTSNIIDNNILIKQLQTTQPCTTDEEDVLNPTAIECLLLEAILINTKF